MSLITRCPACGTMFKVVPDQLRISEGWVRCGHCAEIFDASANLQAEHAVAGLATRDTEPGPLPPAAESPAGLASPPPSGYEEGDSQGFASSLTTRTGEEAAAGVPDSTSLEQEAREMREDPLDLPFHFRLPAEDSKPAAAGGAAEPELDDLTFVREAQRKAFWQRTTVRVALALLLIALAATLAGQAGVHERDRIAATQPQLRPWLAKLCEPLRCAIGPPHQIESLTIETSAFNKLRGDAYRLTFTLRNQATMDVAAPALELTLTDGQDQPVLRRVLTPAELGLATGSIAATSEASASLSLAVASSGLGGRVAGYRLLAFYP